MKTTEEIKESMLQYVRSDIEVLREQNEEKEAMAYINRVRALIGSMSLSGLITDDEAEELYDEFGKARQKASEQIID